jgi:hypothetical protein
MPSFTNQLNGEILMVMDSGIKKMETKQMLAQQHEGHQFLIGLDAGIQMVMAGRTQQMAGKLIHTDLLIHSQLKPFSGEIPMLTDLETYLSVLCEMIAQKSLEPRPEMFKDVRIRMTMDGQMNMVNGTQLSLSWAKTLLLRG